MHTRFSNLRQLEAARKKAGFKTFVRYASYYSLTIRGKVRMYYFVNEHGTRLYDDFPIVYNSDVDDFLD